LRAVSESRFWLFGLQFLACLGWRGIAWQKKSAALLVGAADGYVFYRLLLD
jgi:hypothetical protein